MKAPRLSGRRIPAGMPRRKLKVEGLAANKRGYWATESQTQELLDAGYTFVANSERLVIGEDGRIDKGNVISRPAARASEEKLYLMEIDKDWYAENQAQKQAAIDATERAMFERPNTKTGYAVPGNKHHIETLGGSDG